VIALIRAVPDALAACELTHLERVPIDVARAREQHAAYRRMLAALGCGIVDVPPAHDRPDSVFVEDAAVVVDEMAIITRPGAASRRSETTAIAETLGAFRQLRFLVEPATLDGGDVLRLGWTLYVAVGGRTNAAGVQQLRDFVAAYGYEVRPVTVDGCLHLKSAVTEVAPGVVVLNPKWVDSQMFPNHAIIEVDPAEPAAGNVLRIGEALVCGAAYRRTNARLSALAPIYTVDVSELAKAEGAVTCCSVIFLESGPRTAEWASARR
jgi:dimethylargininase